MESCVPATGRVTITHTARLMETMHVEVSGLPANTDFDLFIIQDNSALGGARFRFELPTNASS